MAACQLTIDKLQGQKYLWTFTFRECLPIPEAKRRWHHLLTDLVRKMGWYGVRVLERHKSHGLHIHVVVNEYYDVNQVRILSDRAGFGRIHVVKIRPGSEYYVSKYLGKQRRGPELKGERLWQSFGRVAGVAVRSIRIESTINTIRKWVSLSCVRGIVKSQCPVRWAKSEWTFINGVANALYWVFVTGDYGRQRQSAEAGDIGQGSLPDCQKEPTSGRLEELFRVCWSSGLLRPVAVEYNREQKIANLAIDEILYRWYVA